MSHPKIFSILDIGRRRAARWSSGGRQRSCGKHLPRSGSRSESKDWVGDKSNIGLQKRDMATWNQISAADAPSPRSSHQLSSYGTSLFLFGGECGPIDSHFGYGTPVPTTVHTIDLDTPAESLAWRQVEITAGSAPSARLGHGQAVAVIEGHPYLYVGLGRQPTDAGAPYDGSEDITSLNDIHRLSLRTGAWEEIKCKGSAPSPRSYSGMIRASDPATDKDMLFVFGGMIDNTRYSDLYALDLATHTWRQLPDGPMEGRGGAGLCASNGSLWVVGGFCGRPVGDVWEFSIGTGTWTRHAAMELSVPRSIFACQSTGRSPTGRGAAVVVFGGELVAAGGNNEAGVYSNEVLSISFEQGDSSADVSEFLAPSPTNTTASGNPPSLVSVVQTGGRDTEAAAVVPAARGWTSGCMVELQRGSNETAFAVFGGIRQGGEGEPAGVRMGDLHLLVWKN